PVGAFALLLARSIRFGEPSATGQRRHLEIDDQVARAFDEDGYGDRSQAPGMLVRLEFVELEPAADAAACRGSRESPEMEALAVLPEQPQAMRDGPARATDDARRL